MKKFTLIIAVAVVVVLGQACIADTSYLRGFLIAGKKLGAHTQLKSVNFAVKSPSATNAWCYLGPSIGFGGTHQHALDLFIGRTFPQGTDGEWIASTRLWLRKASLTFWQDVEWYPASRAWFTATRTSLDFRGLTVGGELEVFKPSNAPTAWHAGPFIGTSLSKHVGVEFTWHYQPKQFGGQFTRLTLSVFP